MVFALVLTRDEHHSGCDEPDAGHHHRHQQSSHHRHWHAKGDDHAREHSSLPRAGFGRDRALVRHGTATRTKMRSREIRIQDRSPMGCPPASSRTVDSSLAGVAPVELRSPPRPRMPEARPAWTPKAKRHSPTRSRSRSLPGGRRAARANQRQVPRQPPHPTERHTPGSGRTRRADSRNADTAPATCGTGGARLDKSQQLPQRPPGRSLCLPQVQATAAAAAKHAIWGRHPRACLRAARRRVARHE